MDDETEPAPWAALFSARNLGLAMGLLGLLAIGVGLWPQSAETPPPAEAAMLEVLDAPGTTLLEGAGIPDEGGGDSEGELATLTEPTEAAAITIYIVGAVRVPGVYTLPASARVHDAVARAGGLSPDADSLRVNLAQTVVDGQQIVVPQLGEASVPEAATVGGAGAQAERAAAGRLLNINTASAAELEELPKIGATLAQRIVEYREANGAFADVEGLRAVQGLSASIVGAIAPLVVAE
jgi:competence protein ComEA